MRGRVAALLAAGILAFDGDAAAAPACRTAFEEPEFAFAAGCLVRSGERMLLVRHRFGGKLGFPAGWARPGENAQCVAHRETWEETGLNVVVHELIARLGTGLALYRCELDGAAGQAPSPGAEIREVIWRDPRSTRAGNWRFPNDYPLILELFGQVQP